MYSQNTVIKQKKLKQFYHNPRVGGSSPSSATIFINIINNLYRLKKDIEAIFFITHFLHTFDYTKINFAGACR
jgi:hypothetical protein